MERELYCIIRVKEVRRGRGGLLGEIKLVELVIRQSLRDKIREVELLGRVRMDCWKGLRKFFFIITIKKPMYS